MTTAHQLSNVMLEEQSWYSTTIHDNFRAKPKVEAPIADHSRDYAPDLEKYEAVQIFSV